MSSRGSITLGELQALPARYGLCARGSEDFYAGRGDRADPFYLYREIRTRHGRLHLLAEEPPPRSVAGCAKSRARGRDEIAAAIRRRAGGEGSEIVGRGFRGS